MCTQYYNGAFIDNNELVDKHLEDIGYSMEVGCVLWLYLCQWLRGIFFVQTATEPGMCGTTRWKTAQAASKTMPHQDEMGVELAGCRHGIAQKAVNMFHGEM